MSNSEQYRAGFEAWAIGPDGEWVETALKRAGNGDYIEPEVREQFKGYVAAMQQREASTEPRIADMALLIARLSYSLKRAAPEHEMPAKATAYLKKHNLIGSPLRGADEAGAGALPDEAKDAARCDNCQHWKVRQEYERGHGLGLGECTNIPMFWNATEWDDEGEGRRFRSSFEGVQAFVQDGSDYMAEVLTKPGFGCRSFAAIEAHTRANGVKEDNKCA